jgi:adenylate kinase
VAGKCDVTGEDLIQRDDDNPEIVRHRLEVYHAQTAPVVEFYGESGRLVVLDGMADIAAVNKQIEEALAKKRNAA